MFKTLSSTIIVAAVASRPQVWFARAARKFQFLLVCGVRVVDPRRSADKANGWKTGEEGRSVRRC